MVHETIEPNSSGGSGTVPDSRWAGYYSGASPAAAQDGWTTVDGWTEDDPYGVAGTDITLQPDGHTLQLDTTGGKNYLIEAWAYTTFDHGTTGCLAQVDQAGDSGDGRGAALTTPAVVNAGSKISVMTLVVGDESYAGSPIDINLQVLPFGGSAAEAVANGGITVVRTR